MLLKLMDASRVIAKEGIYNTFLSRIISLFYP